MEVNRILDFMPLCTPEEGAVASDVHPSTVRRHFHALEEKKRATYHVVGRGGHTEQRWCYSSSGLTHHYPESMAPWWLRASGIRTLIPRVEQTRAAYRILPRLFFEQGKEWHEKAEPPQLCGIRFLRPVGQGPEMAKSGMIQLVGVYTDGIQLLCCYLGKELLRSVFAEKWANRCMGLHTYTQSQADDLDRNIFVEPRSSDYDLIPRLAGNVIIAADLLAMDIALQTIPREEFPDREPYLFITADGKYWRCERKTLSGSTGWLSNLPVKGKLGKPERAISPDVPHPADILGEVLVARILELVEDWSGPTVRQIARLTRRTKQKVREALQRMIGEDWLVEKRGMHYLGKAGISYVAKRDRVSEDTVETRVAAAIKDDHKPVGAQFLHTKAVNEVMIRLVEARVPVFPGWRSVTDLEGTTQLKPDLVFFAETKLGFARYHVEVERTAKHPEQVKEKLEPYILAYSLGWQDGVIFITETARAEALFQQWGGGLPMLTSTIREVKRGPVWGVDTVWRYRNTSVILR